MDNILQRARFLNLDKTTFAPSNKDFSDENQNDKADHDWMQRDQPSDFIPKLKGM